uniref:Uncharacterized protein n=1 Tax=Zooxanthella nutricula TaxID=1333877 RepID=A0A7S2J0N8_9DINO
MDARFQAKVTGIANVVKGSEAADHLKANLPPQMHPTEVGDFLSFTTTHFEAERLVAWYGGKNMGSVNQWLYLSSNGKVVKQGQRVKSEADIPATRMAYVNEKGSVIPVSFPVGVEAGMTGTVHVVYAFDNVPTSGSAIITFDLPSAMTKSGGSGFTTGPLIVPPQEFAKLEVLNETRQSA